MTVTALFTAKLEVTEQITVGVPDAIAAQSNIVHNVWNISDLTLTPTTMTSSFVATLVAGALTVDLRALTGYGGYAIDGVGLRVQGIFIQALATNAAVVTIAIGASNGYDGFGSTFAVTLKAGGVALISTLDNGSDIAAGKKTLDLSGTGTDAVNIQLVMG